MALAHARLLLEQAGLQQRLADLVRQRAVVAGESAGHVVEGRVVAAPLAHAVEPLQDPAGHAAHGVRVLVRARDGARGLQQAQHLVLERLDGLVVERRAAQAGHRLRHAQRVRGADRRAQVRPALQHVAGQQVRAGAQAVDAPLLELRVEGLVRVLRRLQRLGRRVGEQEHPVELAEAQPQVVARAGRPGRGALHHLLHRGRRQRGRALAHRARVRAQLRRHRQRGQQLALHRRHGHGDRRLVAGARLSELAGAALQLGIEQAAQLCGGVARRVGAARLAERLLELGARLEPSGQPTRH